MSYSKNRIVYSLYMTIVQLVTTYMIPESIFDTDFRKKIPNVSLYDNSLNLLEKVIQDRSRSRDNVKCKILSEYLNL